MDMKIAARIMEYGILTQLIDIHIKTEALSHHHETVPPLFNLDDSPL